MSTVNEKAPFDPAIKASGLSISDFSSGDKVQVITDNPMYKWGSSVKRGDVGVVSSVRSGEVWVNFNTHQAWKADPNELINMTKGGGLAAVTADIEELVKQMRSGSTSTSYADDLDQLIAETKELQKKALAINYLLEQNKSLLRSTYKLELI